jgi:hypothetical protein
LVFTSLAEAFETSKTNVEKPKQPIKEVKMENLDKKTPGTKPVQKNEVIPSKRLDEMVARFKHLANIDNNKNYKKKI